MHLLSRVDKASLEVNLSGERLKILRSAVDASANGDTDISSKHVGLF